MFGCKTPDCPDCASREHRGKTTRPDICRRCFWYESGSCFQAKFGPVPKMRCACAFNVLGFEITPGHLAMCARTRKGAVSDQVSGWAEGPFD